MHLATMHLLDLSFHERPFDLCFAVHDLGEDGHIRKEVLKNHAVADAGRISLVLNLVQNEAGAGEAPCLDIFDGEQGVVQAAELVVHDNNHGQGEALGQVCHGRELIERHFPTTSTFNEDMLMPRSEGVKGGDELGDIKTAVFHHRGGIGRGGDLEPDGVHLVQTKPRWAETGIEEVDGIVTRTANERFIACCGFSGAFEGFEQEACDVGFACIGIRAGDEVMVGHAGLLEAINAHAADALGFAQADGIGGFWREIDDTPADVGTAIIDTDDDPAAVVKIRAADEASEWPVTMGGGEGGSAKSLPTGGAAVRVKGGNAVLALDDACGGLRNRWLGGGAGGEETAQHSRQNAENRMTSGCRHSVGMFRAWSRSDHF